MNMLLPSNCLGKNLADFVGAENEQIMELCSQNLETEISFLAGALSKWAKSLRRMYLKGKSKIDQFQRHSGMKAYSYSGYSLVSDMPAELFLQL